MSPQETNLVKPCGNWPQRKKSYQVKLKSKHQKQAVDSFTMLASVASGFYLGENFYDRCVHAKSYMVTMLMLGLAKNYLYFRQCDQRWRKGSLQANFLLK